MANEGTTKQCDYCMHLAYDSETDEYYCPINLDQDEIGRYRESKYEGCPYFRLGDDYTIVKKQI